MTNEKAEEGYAMLLDMQRAAGRECGGCTMCCRLLGVDAPPQLSKPPDVACPHCNAGKSCAIYDHRPVPCRYFFCQWLVNRRLGDDWYPAKSHIVISASEEGPLIIEVDRNRPDRWLQQPYFEVISSIAANDLSTSVRVGKRWYSLIPAEAAKHPENICLTWRSQQLGVCGALADHPVKTIDGREFVWMEVDAPEAFQDAWRADFKR